MAAMTFEPRDPDMAHFIDTYKYDRQMEEKRKVFGGGTSLPLNSDGYEDRQRFLREERHKDWADQQERQRKVEAERIEQRRQTQRQPAPPQGYQIDYNQAHELTKAEDRRAYQDHQGKFTIPIESKILPRPQISYEENKKVLAQERKQDYAMWQEQRAKEERMRAMRGRPVTPQGGLNVGQYDRQVKETAAQKKKEYKDMLDQQKKEHMFVKAQQEPEVAVLERPQPSNQQYLANKPPPGPGYRPSRDEAFQTNTYSRPRSRGREQEQGYVPSLSDAPLRGQPYDENRRPPPRDLPPPTSPSRRTPPPQRSSPRKSYEAPMEQGRSQPKSPSRRSPPPRTPPNDTQQQNQSYSRPAHIDVSPRRHKALEMEESQYDRMRKDANLVRKEEYNVYLKQKQDTQRQQAGNRNPGRPAEVVKGPHYSSDNYESYQSELRRKQLEDYRDFLKKTNQAPRFRGWKDGDSALLLPEDHTIEYKKRELQAERKREYNEHLAQSKAPPNHFWPEPDPGRGSLWLSRGEYDGVKQMYEEERRKDFIESCERKRQQRINEVPRRDDYGSNVSGPYDGMFHGLGEGGSQKAVLKEQRRQDYNEQLDQQYSQRERPHGRPSWAKDPVTDFGDGNRTQARSPVKTDHYEQMLHEKRREEAQRRRYDDPEYQDKLARVDSRTGQVSDQQRYGY